MVVLLAALFALALVLLLWLWAIGPQLPQADFSAFHKYDYAHRGLHNREKGVPENSLMAFELAARGGFGMELDVQLTQDGQVVVHHDRSLGRTCGVERNIDEMTCQELSGYRLFGTQEKCPCSPGAGAGGRPHAADCGNQKLRPPGGAVPKDYGAAGGLSGPVLRGVLRPPGGPVV